MQRYRPTPQAEIDDPYDDYAEVDEFDIMVEDDRGDFVMYVDAVALLTEIAELRKALKGVLDVGHNDDCIFCGLKDRLVVKLTC